MVGCYSLFGYGVKANLGSDLTPRGESAHVALQSQNIYGTEVLFRRLCCVTGLTV